jgi:hypothetical protein
MLPPLENTTPPDRNPSGGDHFINPKGQSTEGYPARWLQPTASLFLGLGSTFCTISTSMRHYSTLKE